MSSLGVQEGSRAVMVVLPGYLFLLISWPGHRAFSLAGRLRQWNSVMMEPNRSAASLGSPANLPSLAPTVLEFPLEVEQWFELLQILVFVC